MKVHTTNYKNTFILVAEDCHAKVREYPSIKDGAPTAAALHFEMIKKNPYKYTPDEILF